MFIAILPADFPIIVHLESLTIKSLLFYQLRYNDLKMSDALMACAGNRGDGAWYGHRGLEFRWPGTIRVRAVTNTGRGRAAGLEGRKERAAAKHRACRPGRFAGHQYLACVA